MHLKANCPWNSKIFRKVLIILRFWWGIYSLKTITKQIHWLVIMLSTEDSKSKSVDTSYLSRIDTCHENSTFVVLNKNYSWGEITMVSCLKNTSQRQMWDTKLRISTLYRCFSSVFQVTHDDDFIISVMRWIHLINVTMSITELWIMFMKVIN